MDKPPEIYCSFALWIIQQIIVNNGDYGSNGYYLKKQFMNVIILFINSLMLTRASHD